jgi:hypothetical protein
MDTFFRSSNTTQMQYKIYKPLAIKGYKFVRNDRTVRSRTDTDGGGVGIYIRSSLRHTIVRQSTEIWSGVSVREDNAIESGNSCRFGV